MMDMPKDIRCCQFCGEHVAEPSLLTCHELRCAREKLAALQQGIRKAVEFAVIVKNYPLNHEGELVYTVEDMNSMATALLPELERLGWVTRRPR